jgi:hypothetical protein
MSYENKNTPLIKDIAEKQLEQALIISELRNDVADLKLGMQRILFFHDNDNKTGSPGLVEQVRLNRLGIEKLDRFKNELKVTIGLIGAFGGIIGNLFLIIIKSFFK